VNLKTSAARSPKWTDGCCVLAEAGVLLLPLVLLIVCVYCFLIFDVDIVLSRHYFFWNKHPFLIQIFGRQRTT
jgi:hypothetical protein